MFGNNCFRCGNKIKEMYEFCPFCGTSFRTHHDNEDYGFLGKNDSVESTSPFSSDPFIEQLFHNAMKLLERQMKHFQKEFIKEARPAPKEFHHLNIQFFVNGKRVFPERAEHVEREALPLVKTDTRQLQGKFKNSVNLPRKEPDVRLRRLSGKLIYEIDLPGVKSVRDILINRLESSLEIKALADNEVYLKQLPVTFPILDYRFTKGTLTIELAAG